MSDSKNLNKSSVDRQISAYGIPLYSPFKMLIINVNYEYLIYTIKKCINNAINNYIAWKCGKMCPMIDALKNTFRNSSLGKAVIAGALAIPLSLASLGPAANDAYAGEAKAAALSQMRVPHAFLETNGVDSTRVAVGLGTKEKVALVYYGNDPEHIEQAQQAIEKLNKEGWPALLVIAKGDSDESAYDVFVDQERWVPFGDGLRPVGYSPKAGMLESAIGAGYERYQSVRMNVQTSSLERN